MGVAAQNDLGGGAPNFFPKNDLINFARKIIWTPAFFIFLLNKISTQVLIGLYSDLVGFFVQLRMISKKRKVIVPIWSTFSFLS